MQTTNARVLASLPTSRANHRAPRAINALAVLVILIAAVAGIAAVAVVSQQVAHRDAGYALASVSVPVPMPASHPLTTAAPGTVWYAPDYDTAGNATCPSGQQLLDTENPDVGDSGIVCVATLRAV